MGGFEKADVNPVKGARSRADGYGVVGVYLGDLEGSLVHGFGFLR